MTQRLGMFPPPSRYSLSALDDLDMSNAVSVCCICPPEVAKVVFQSIDHCSLWWLCCCARYWMLQDLDDMEASCISYDKVQTFDQLVWSIICILNVSTMGIVRRNVRHGMIVSVSFMWDPWNFLRQTSADILCPEELPVHIWKSRDICCGIPLFITVNTQTRLDWLTANRGTLGNCCNMQPFAAGFILSRMYKLAVTDSLSEFNQMIYFSGVSTSFRCHLPLLFPMSKSGLHRDISQEWADPNRADRWALHPMRQSLAHTNNADTS